MWTDPNVYGEEDYDAVDGFMDELKQTKNRLVAFVRKATNNKQFKQIGKELFSLIVEVIQDSMEDELDIKYVAIQPRSPGDEGGSNQIN